MQLFLWLGKGAAGYMICSIPTDTVVLYMRPKWDVNVPQPLDCLVASPDGTDQKLLFTSTRFRQLRRPETTLSQISCKIPLDIKSFFSTISLKLCTSAEGKNR